MKGERVPTTKAESEKRRNELGFHQVGNAGGIPIYVSAERANATDSKRRADAANLKLATYQLLLSGFTSDSSLSGKLNDSGKTDTSFWIAGTGRDTNHFVTESQGPEITESQEAEALKLAESGMQYEEIARKLDIPAVGVYYALKKKGAKTRTRSKKPRTSALLTFDNKGSLSPGRGDSVETTVRISTGIEDEPLLFFVLRDSYSRVGGARFVIAACNGRQFTADLPARLVLGVPQEA